MKKAETHTPMSPEEKDGIAQSFYEDFAVVHENWLNDRSGKRPADPPLSLPRSSKGSRSVQHVQRMRTQTHRQHR